MSTLPSNASTADALSTREPVVHPLGEEVRVQCREVVHDLLGRELHPASRPHAFVPLQVRESRHEKVRDERPPSQRLDAAMLEELCEAINLRQLRSRQREFRRKVRLASLGRQEHAPSLGRTHWSPESLMQRASASMLTNTLGAWFDHARRRS